MSVNDQFGSAFGHVREPNKNGVLNTLFPTIESELSSLGDTVVPTPNSKLPSTTVLSPNNELPTSTETSTNGAEPTTTKETSEEVASTKGAETPTPKETSEALTSTKAAEPTTTTATSEEVTTTKEASPKEKKRPDPPTFEKQGDAVRHEKSKHTPKNTKLAYNSKAKEFQGYLNSVFGGTGEKESSLVITPSKVFGFMYYQCHRGKRNKQQSSSGKFDRAEYDAVMANSGPMDEKTDLLQNDSIQHYLGAIRNLLDEQIRLGITETRKDDIMTKGLKDLITLVKNRRERVLKSLSKE